ncbi:MAG: hypothetical protein LIP01_09970 [Tannerellaceae bacterium]|nr:hypothetical protein [Tannerellaceae bacterium]
MGTPQGMLIYSLQNPLEPEYHSEFRHIYGCDPVVVEDDIAYVTVRSGNTCGQNQNVLYVIDAKDTRDPRLLYSYDMVNPKGVGIDNKTLFICDDGLKIYNAEDPLRIDKNMLVHKEGMNGFDVIPYKDVLMMIAEDAIYQYDYSDTENIKELSKLTFK